MYLSSKPVCMLTVFKKVRPIKLTSAHALYVAMYVYALP